MIAGCLSLIGLILLIALALWILKWLAIIAAGLGLVWLITVGIARALEYTEASRDERRVPQRDGRVRIPCGADGCRSVARVPQSDVTGGLQRLHWYQVGLGPVGLCTKHKPQ